MTARPITVYTVECDGCHVLLGDGEWCDEPDAFADDAGWWCHSGRHFCTACLPDWCAECDADITDENPRSFPDSEWGCHSCHSECATDSPCRRGGPCVQAGAS